MEKTGFIYIWYDCKNKKYYVGSHLGTEDDGYVCSSRWMRQSYKRRPEDFKRRILRRNIPKQILKEEEYRWLKLIKKEELGKRYYNLTVALNGNGWVKGSPRSEETKKKISETLKGNIPWNKGKNNIYSEATKKKISVNTKKAISSLSDNKLSNIKRSHFKKGHTTWNKGKKGSNSHMKVLWANPEFKKQRSERLKEAWKKRKNNE